MVEQPFERETLLDITVNLIPFAMIIAFLLLFTLVRPMGGASSSTFPSVVMYGLLLFKLLTLGTVTYIGAKYVSRDEP